MYWGTCSIAYLSFLCCDNSPSSFLPLFSDGAATTSFLLASASFLIVGVAASFLTIGGMISFLAGAATFFLLGGALRGLGISGNESQ